MKDAAYIRAGATNSFICSKFPVPLPAISQVFVQSRNGTGADNPENLGGAPTDKYLIYEGLSRVAADGSWRVRGR